MFAGTPRVRDLLDLRAAVTIAVVALLAFGLQLGALAGLFASPLGDAVARFDAAPRGAPAEAVAGADREGAEPRDAAEGGRVVSVWLPDVTGRATVHASCVVTR